MEENKDVDMEEIEVCMSRQTPLIFPFEEEKVNFEIKNITISEVINPSPHTFQLWYPQEESLTNLQFFSYSKKLSRLIELELEVAKEKQAMRSRKISPKDQNI
ncbi:unnamed protein product [Blepharisma stoltei]|uniref:Uncharacterized protein n=1 Tax=Blepharisma stoltei TaxID=1481888 RepID=A0AAU9J674_9CILI|nr:unnamed protein product [Blepharisma stoltei]